MMKICIQTKSVGKPSQIVKAVKLKWKEDEYFIIKNNVSLKYFTVTIEKFECKLGYFAY